MKDFLNHKKLKYLFLWFDLHHEENIEIMKKMKDWEGFGKDFEKIYYHYYGLCQIIINISEGIMKK